MLTLNSGYYIVNRYLNIEKKLNNIHKSVKL